MKSTLIIIIIYNNNFQLFSCSAIQFNYALTLADVMGQNITASSCFLLQLVFNSWLGLCCKEASYS